MSLSLQEKYAPRSICFGCGPANGQGLQIKSHLVTDQPTVETIARFTPAPHHHAFPGVLNGGIIGALLDCHSNWTAAYALKQDTMTDVPCTVTSEFSVKLLRPTPMDQELVLKAKCLEIQGDKAKIEATLTATLKGVEKVCATCTGWFVAVKEGHPAFHRWG